MPPAVDDVPRLDERGRLDARLGEGEVGQASDAAASLMRDERLLGQSSQVTIFRSARW